MSVFITWLFTTYGDIDHDAISEEVDKVLEMSYNIQDPMTNIFEPIQDLEQLAVTDRRPYTQAQLDDFRVTLVTKTHDFEIVLLNWHNLPDIQQTWPTFKTRFSNARRNLKKVRGKTMRSAGYHQANMMTTTIDEFRNEIIESVRQVQDNVITALHSPPTRLEEILSSPQIQTANVVVTNSDISGLVTMMNSLTTTVQNIQNNMNNDGTGRGGNGRRRGR